MGDIETRFWHGKRMCGIKGTDISPVLLHRFFCFFCFNCLSWVQQRYRSAILNKWNALWSKQLFSKPSVATQGSRRSVPMLICVCIYLYAGFFVVCTSRVGVCGGGDAGQCVIPAVGWDLLVSVLSSLMLLLRQLLVLPRHMLLPQTPWV